jgi:hypothetical protein
MDNATIVSPVSIFDAAGMASAFNDRKGRKGRNGEKDTTAKYVMVAVNCSQAHGRKRLYAEIPAADKAGNIVLEHYSWTEIYHTALSVVNQYRGNSPITGERTTWKGNGRNEEYSITHPVTKAVYTPQNDKEVAVKCSWLGICEEGGKPTYRAVMVYSIGAYNWLLEQQAKATNTGTPNSAPKTGADSVKVEAK